MLAYINKDDYNLILAQSQQITFENIGDFYEQYLFQGIQMEDILKVVQMYNLQDIF